MAMAPAAVATVAAAVTTSAKPGPSAALTAMR
jgi:hypothetical protein